MTFRAQGRRDAQYIANVSVSPSGRLAAIMLAAAASCCAAQADDHPVQPIPLPELVPVDELADTARVSVRAATVWLARGVDSWFGDKPFEEGGKVSDGRLSGAWFVRQGDEPQFDLRFNARFGLPNIEDRLYAFIGRDDRRDVLTDRPGAFSRQSRLLADELRDSEFFAGLGRSLNDAVDVRLGFRGGLKPYAQLRYRQEWLPREDELIAFRQTLFWSVDDHLGSTTVLSFEHAFSPELEARWLNSATITQESKAFEWSSLLGAYRSFGDQRLLGLEGLVGGLQGSGVRFTDAGLQARWEQPVHEDWLLGGLVIGHFWPRENALVERRSAWALGLSLKMRF
jgi:hypothetical protein